jgi:hypothetical protein
MIQIVATIYGSMCVVTWAYAGFLTGIQFSKTVRANPTANVQVNWLNVFWQGVTWVGFWASFVGEKFEKRTDIRELNKIMLDKVRKS